MHACSFVYLFVCLLACLLAYLFVGLIIFCSVSLKTAIFSGLNSEKKKSENSAFFSVGTARAVPVYFDHLRTGRAFFDKVTSCALR